VSQLTGTTAGGLDQVDLAGAGETAL
jgi:hypothetical protein